MKVLLAVCGSISAYKTFDLTRELTKSGHEVKVILTKGAIEFVNPKVFRYLGAKEVYLHDDDFNYPRTQEDPGNVLHVELGKWCDKFIIAPLSANTLGRLCSAQADDLLSTTFLALASHKPILIFPAMNSNMLTHKFVQENFENLKKLKTLEQVFIAKTKSGLLACGDQGSGKLLDINEIIDLIETVNPLSTLQRKVLITTGATLSPIDPVRYVTNPSSGKTGYYLAKEALKNGMSVSLIAGKNSSSLIESLYAHPNIEIIRVGTTNKMYEEVLSRIQEASCFIASAAVCDLNFSYLDKKMKKEDLSKSSLEFTKAIDILKEMIKLKKPSQYFVGFAAENPISLKVLLEKQSRKPVDLLIGTHVNSGLNSDNQQGFNKEDASYSILEKDKIILESNLSKKELSSLIIEKFLIQTDGRTND